MDDFEIIGASNGERHHAAASALGFEDGVWQDLRTGCQILAEARGAGDGHRPFGCEFSRYQACRQIEIMQQHRQPRFVTGREMAGQQHIGDQRVTHRHRRIRRTDTLALPGNRHQPDLAGKIANIEREAGAPFGVGLYRGEEFGHRAIRIIARHRPAIVAALAQHGGKAVGWGDQPAPIVANIDANVPPPDEMRRRIRGHETGEAQNPFIHCRQTDPSARCGAHRDSDPATRQAGFRRLNRRIELTGAGIGADPGDPDRSARPCARSGPEDMHGNIGTGTPPVGHWHINISAARRDRDGAER